jgi:acetyl esterase/lipase
VAADPAYLAAHDLDPTDIRCVAPLDTEGFDIARNIENGGASARLYRSVFGDDPGRWAALSPRTHLGEAPLPDLFLVTRGSAERRAQTTDFADAAEATGARVTVIDLPGFSHADVNQRIGDPADQLLTPALQDFLLSCLDLG